MCNDNYDVDQRVLNDRIEELETRLAFHEDTLQSLDKVIAEQDKLLARQQLQLQMLAEKLKSMDLSADELPGPAVDERPPHY